MMYNIFGKDEAQQQFNKELDFIHLQIPWVPFLIRVVEQDACTF